MRDWAAPFNPSGVVAEAADLCHRYRVRTIVGDNFGAEWIVEPFRLHGITYRGAALDRSRLYLELLWTVNAQGIVLPDLPPLLRELRGLERRRGVSGRDRIVPSPHEHDDRAVSVAGLAAGFLVRGQRGFEGWRPSGPEPARPVTAGRGHRAGVARVPERVRLAGRRAHRSRAVPLVPPEGPVVAARGVGVLGQGAGPHGVHTPAGFRIARRAGLSRCRCGRVYGRASPAVVVVVEALVGQRREGAGTRGPPGDAEDRGLGIRQWMDVKSAGARWGPAGTTPLTRAEWC